MMKSVYRILFVTATEAEGIVLRNNPSCVHTGNNVFRYGNIEITMLVAGVGAVPTAWSMMKWFSVKGMPDLAINAGIAGSFQSDIVPGEVVIPVTEIFADAGIEDRGSFSTLHETGLVNPDEFPFRKGVLSSDQRLTDPLKLNLRRVKGITCNMATGSETTREMLIKKYNPDIETMEGASFFYICLRENVPFVAFRAISNYAGPRNRKEWKIGLALDKLSGTLNEVILKMQNE